MGLSSLGEKIIELSKTIDEIIRRVLFKVLIEDSAIFSKDDLSEYYKSLVFK